jgi:MPBQ/MSBQ methyltransferase
MEQSVNEYFEQLTRRGARRVQQDGIGFLNEGYWKGVEGSVELAQLNMIETLVSFFCRRDGNVLDVACGRGASSKFLTKYFDPKNITGIEASEGYLQVCRVFAPDCDFRRMDATKLEFADSSFDNFLCMEAAYHFNTRHEFLEEAYRVLRSGGRLAVSDHILRDDEYGPFIERLHRMYPDWPTEGWPKENCLPTLDAYRKSLLEIGFKYVRIEDTTEFVEAPFRNFCIRKAEREEDYETLQVLMNDEDFGTHCFVYASK